MKRPTAIILIGIPAAGKSTFYRQRFFETHVRICLDQLRTRYRVEVLLNACIAGRISFVSDNTNATKLARQRYLAPAKSAGYRIVGYYLSSKVDQALDRNRLRAGSARIPDAAVYGIAGRLELPAREEGFDELWYVRMDQEGGFIVVPWRDE